MRYLEDVVLGESFHSEASYLLEEEEIVSFCAKWDPLPFHVDNEAAAKTPVGKLFTSAIHTLAIGAHLIHSIGQEPMAVIAGLGWDDVRFLAPVCVGDRLKSRGEVIEVRPSKGNDDRGVVGYSIEVINQDEAIVLRFKSSILIWRRGAEGAPPPEEL